MQRFPIRQSLRNATDSKRTCAGPRKDTLPFSSRFRTAPVDGLIVDTKGRFWQKRKMDSRACNSIFESYSIRNFLGVPFGDRMPLALPKRTDQIHFGLGVELFEEDLRPARTGFFKFGRMPRSRNSASEGDFRLIVMKTRSSCSTVRTRYENLYGTRGDGAKGKNRRRKLPGYPLSRECRKKLDHRVKGFENVSIFFYSS